MENNLINEVYDLFTLELGDIKDLPGFKEKSAEKALAAIDAVRNIPLHRLLISLSIRHVGEETAVLIANYFGSLDKVREAGVEELAAINGVGEVVARSLHDWMRENKNIHVLDELLKYVTVVEPEAGGAGQALAGLSMVFTGTLPTLDRDEAKELAHAAGANIASSVSKKTDYVVLGENAGSKADKAAELGVKTINEAEFLKLLG